MSHPIDDLFKKGLTNQDYDGLDKDWQDARQLLGLGNRKRRAVFWLWGIFGILLVTLVARSLYYRSFVQGDDKLEYAVTVIEDNNPGSTDQSKLEIMPDATAEIINKKEKREEENTDEKIVRENSKIQSIARADSKFTKDEKIKKSASEKSVVQDRNGRELAEVIIEKGGETRKTENGIKAGNRTNEQPVLEIENPLLSIGDNVLTHNSTVHLWNGLSSLNNRGISELPNSINLPKIDSKKLLVSDYQDVAAVKGGVYVGFDPIAGIPEAGLSGYWNINARWSVDMGVGISRFSNRESRVFDKIVVDNRIVDNAILISDNTYKYYSIKLPVRLKYHVQKHQIFFGIIPERPYSLDGRQEISLKPDAIDVGTPGSDPVFGLSNTDPISSLQNYNLNSTPQLNKFFIHGQAGYGYSLSNHFQISLSATYRMNNRGEVSPLFSINNQRTDRSDSWNALIRIDYIFGK